MPIAFTMGDNDSLVPPESALRLAAKLASQNSKVLVINRSQGGHNTSFEDAMSALEFMFSSSSKGKQVNWI